jgi:hypothetical protein
MALQKLRKISIQFATLDLSRQSFSFTDASAPNQSYLLKERHLSQVQQYSVLTIAPGEGVKLK